MCDVFARKWDVFARSDVFARKWDVFARRRLPRGVRWRPLLASLFGIFLWMVTFGLFAPLIPQRILELQLQQQQQQQQQEAGLVKNGAFLARGASAAASLGAARGSGGGGVARGVVGKSATGVPVRLAGSSSSNGAAAAGNDASTSDSDAGSGDAVAGASLFVGALTFAFNVGNFVGAAPAGALSDAVGRKMFLVLSLVATSVDAACLALVPLLLMPPGTSAADGALAGAVAVMCVSRFLCGLLCPAWSIAFAMAADCTASAPPRERTAAFAMAWMTFGTSQLVSGPVGGALASGTGSTVMPMLLASGCGLLSSLYVLFLMPETRLLALRKGDGDGDGARIDVATEDDGGDEAGDAPVGARRVLTRSQDTSDDMMDAESVNILARSIGDGDTIFAGEEEEEEDQGAGASGSSASIPEGGRTRGLKTLREAWSWSLLNPFQAWMLLRRSNLAASIAAIYFLVYLGEEGLYDTLVLYLILVFKFDSVLIGAAVAVLGVSMVIVQGGLIRVVIPRAGNERTLLGCLLLDAVSVTLYGLVTQAWMVFPIFLVRSGALMTGPSCQGIISSEFSAEDQGGVLGLIGALKAGTAVIGPVVFNPLFSAFTRRDAPVFLPAIVCYVAAAIFLLSFVLALLALCRWGRELRNRVPEAGAMRSRDAGGAGGDGRDERVEELQHLTSSKERWD